MSQAMENTLFKLIALILLILLIPLILLLLLLVKLSSKGPFIFQQKRVGRDKKIFTMLKIRTMIENAEKIQSKYYHLNESDGPIFKIHNDPRYTKIGKFLSHTGLDEIPQLVNIIKGDMAFIGPRPLPVREALKVPKKYHLRFSVLPGISSPWVIHGAHKLNFLQWMQLDLEYIKKHNLWYDIYIALTTIRLVIKLTVSKLLRYEHPKIQSQKRLHYSKIRK